MSHKIKVVFPSNTNHQLASEALSGSSSSYVDDGDCLVFDGDLSYEESVIVKDFNGDISKWKP